MVKQSLNSLLFYFFFRCHEKDRNPPNYQRSVICWDLFLHFLGHFGVKMGNTVGPCYAENQLLFETFSLLIMGDTETALYWFLWSIGLWYNNTAVYPNESMWPDQVSNPGPLTYESGALPTALRGPAMPLVPKNMTLQ